MPVSRIPLAGCNTLESLSCVRISGDVLNNSQSVPVDEMAMEDWVRELDLLMPLRWFEHWLQLQFHCGNPPPAADPKTRIFNEFRLLNRPTRAPDGLNIA